MIKPQTLIFAMLFAMLFADECSKTSGMDAPLLEQEEGRIAPGSTEGSHAEGGKSPLPVAKVAHGPPIVEDSMIQNPMVHVEEGKTGDERHVRFEGVTPASIVARRALDKHFEWRPQKPGEIDQMVNGGMDERYVRKLFMWLTYDECAHNSHISIIHVSYHNGNLQEAVNTRENKLANERVNAALQDQGYIEPGKTYADVLDEEKAMEIGTRIRNEAGARATVALSDPDYSRLREENQRMREENQHLRGTRKWWGVAGTGLGLAVGAAAGGALASWGF